MMKIIVRKVKRLVRKNLRITLIFVRNDYLMQQTATSHFPKAKKTGTTIAGIIFKDGVVLGADTRATEVCFVFNLHA